MSRPARSVTLLTVLMACGSSFTSDDEQAIRRVTDSAVKLANAGRWEEYARLYYADSATVLFFSGR